MSSTSSCFVLAALLSLAADAPKPRLDAHGDPLPEGAIARLGTNRLKSDGPVALSPDGKWIATTKDQAIVFIDPATGKELRRVKQEGEMENAGQGEMVLVFSPDGRQLAALQGDNLSLIDVAKAEVVAAWKTELTNGPVPGAPASAPLQSGLTFSANGKFLTSFATFQADSVISLPVWDLATRKATKVAVSAKGQGQLHVALSPDGKTLATWLSVAEDNSASVIHLWNVESEKEQALFKIDNSAIKKVAFSPDGKQLVVAEEDAALSLWDIAGGKRLRRFLADAPIGQILCFSPDGKQIVATLGDGGIQTWDTASGKRLARHQGVPDDVVALSFPAGDKIKAVSRFQKAIRVWEAPSTSKPTPKEGHDTDVQSLAFSRDTKTLFSTGIDGLSSWDTATWKATRHLAGAKPQAVDPSPRATVGQLLDLGGLSPLSGEAQIVRPDTTGAPQQVYLLSPNGRYFTRAERQGMDVAIVDTVSARTWIKLQLGTPNSPLQSFVTAYSADGSTFAGIVASAKMEGGLNFDVRTWNLERAEEMGTIRLPAQQMPNLMALSADGKLLAISCNIQNPTPAPMPEVSETTLWNIAENKQIAKLSGYTGTITSLAFSPNGQVLVTTSSEKAMQVWAVVDGKLLRSLKGDKDHTWGELAFSPDGRTLAVVDNGEEDDAIEIWELATGKLRSRFTGSRGDVRALAFSPDGRILASGGADTTILLWDLTGTLTLSDKPKDKLTAPELARLWADLDSEDAPKAHEAMARLLAAPADAMSILQTEMKPIAGKALNAADIQKLIVELDSDSFAVREKASQTLREAGAVVRDPLTKALDTHITAETERRIRAILDGLSEPAQQEHLRTGRALELLEKIQSPQARELLKKLADGNPAARLTAEATASVRRSVR